MNWQLAPTGCAFCPVSIHIRHCWRMNSACTGCPCGLPVSFNPHSPLLANELFSRGGNQLGEAGFNPHSPLLANELSRCAGRSEVGHAVSIHIRHCWRMNLHWPAWFSLPACVSIHIRHCWRMNSEHRCDFKAIDAVSIHIRHCWRMN